MKNFRNLALVLMATILTSACAAADELRASGTYVAAGGQSASLTLIETIDGKISGKLTSSGSAVAVAATRQGANLKGTIGPANSGMSFSAVLQGTQLVMNMKDGDEVEKLTFTRIGNPGATAGAPAAPMNSSKRHVIINGRQLGDAELAQLEQTYHVRLPDADFWYDKVLGAWGLKGGPMRGFTIAGLNLGGQLQVDASGRSGTRVYVNGRELPIVDLQGLQQVTGPIMPGRYFINSMGLAGYEGGSPQWDLRAMVAQSQRGGGRSDWQGGILGSSGFSDGDTGAVFLPNGGISSYGN